MIIKAFRDALRLNKIERAIRAADAAIVAKRGDLARQPINQAYNLLLDLTLYRTRLINMIFEWGTMAIELSSQGHEDLANQCKKMEALLQARFDAGDYYREPF